MAQSPSQLLALSVSDSWNRAWAISLWSPSIGVPIIVVPAEEHFLDSGMGLAATSESQLLVGSGGPAR